MGVGTSLINLGELSKPATVLIEKISEAIGGIFSPYQITRTAQAEAKADLIRTKSQIELTDLQRRAMQRFVEEEGHKQENIENITQQALPYINDDSKPERIDNDWITNFFDKCRITSDKEMQLLWGKILAGEANQPGAFPKRSVELLSTMEKSEANLLKQLGSFTWQIESYPLTLVYDFEHPIYKQNGLNFFNLTQLDAIGIISFDKGFRFEAGTPTMEISYFGKKF
jgi:GTPase SAR1 family protein